MLTVLFATRNRAALLREVLASYRQLQPPDSGWKLVVVDNGSSDITDDVLSSFSSFLPLHGLKEPRPGKNAALNAGLEFVEGDLVVLTDDDTFPQSNWLIELRQAADQQSEYSIFGGAVIPRWEAPPPVWVQWVPAGPVFTLTEPSLTEGPMDHRDVFGPNMAIRTSVFRAGVRFDTTIGPSGSSYAMGSETELVLRLGNQGHKAWYVSGAVVEHFIRKEQLEEDWVLKRGLRYGRGKYRLFDRHWNTDAFSWRAVPLHFYRRAAKQAALVALSKIFRREESLFQARWRLNVFRGEIEEAGNLSREKVRNDSTIASEGRAEKTAS